MSEELPILFYFILSYFLKFSFDCVLSFDFDVFYKIQSQEVLNRKKSDSNFFSFLFCLIIIISDRKFATRTFTLKIKYRIELFKIFLGKKKKKKKKKRKG